MSTTQSHFNMSNIKDTTEQANKQLAESSKKVQEYVGSWEKVGSTANTSLGLISAAIKDSNPGISAMIGSVQKLIPNLVELGNAAKKTGSWMKAMTSSAGLLTLITLLTTIITDFDNIAETIGISTDKIEKFKTTAGNVIEKLSGWIGGLGNVILQYLIQPIKGVVEAFNIIKKDGVKGAKDAAKAIGESWKSGLSVKENFNKGQEATTEWVKGIRSRKNKVKEAGKETAKDFIDSWNAEWEAELSEDGGFYKSILDKIEKLKKLNAERKTILGNTHKSVMSQAEEEIAAIDARFEAEKKAKEAAEEAANLKIERNQAYLNSTKELFSSISSMLSDNLDQELENGKITEQQYEKRKKVVKSFQIATIVAELASGVQSIWTAFAKEKAANVLTAAATGPAAAATLSALNAKSLTSAILQTGTLTTTAAAGIASINSGKASASSATISASSPSASVSLPPVTQSYSLNQNYSDSLLEQMNQSLKSQQVVLVVDDVTKVQEGQTRVQTQSSF